MPFKLPYIIVDVTESPAAPQQYATTIIGYPDRSYLWIMAREPVMSEEQYKAHLDKVKVSIYIYLQYMRVHIVYICSSYLQLIYCIVIFSVCM
jgi:lipocalin